MEITARLSFTNGYFNVISGSTVAVNVAPPCTIKPGPKVIPLPASKSTFAVESITKFVPASIVKHAAKFCVLLMV